MTVTGSRHEMEAIVTVTRSIRHDGRDARERLKLEEVHVLASLSEARAIKG